MRYKGKLRPRLERPKGDEEKEQTKLHRTTVGITYIKRPWPSNTRSKHLPLLSRFQGTIAISDALESRALITDTNGLILLSRD